MNRSWFSPYKSDKVGLKQHLSINKTGRLCQIHRSNHEIQMKLGKELTIEGQVVIDLSDQSIFDGEDVDRSSAIDSFRIHLINGKRGRSICSHRFQPDLEWVRAPEEEPIEEGFYIGV